MEYFIGVDLGTTATKAVLFEKNAGMIATSSKAYPLYRDAQGMAEEDFEEIFLAMTQAIKEVASQVNKNSILAISFSSQMHSLIAYDKDWRALTHVITWADTRARKYAEDLKKSEKGMKFYEKTATPIHPMSPLSKLMLLKSEKHEIFNQAAHYLDLKGAIFQRFFQTNKMDQSIATGTGLFSHKEMAWDKEILDFLNISEKQLPEVVSAYAVERGISEKFSQDLAISQDTVFVYGAGDGPLSNLGVGAIQRGELAITVGTSGALRLVMSQAQTDKKARTFSYAIDETHWVTGGAVNSGGDVFRWMKDNIFENRLSFEEITNMASEVEAGAEGLLFHPYLAGERAPLWNAAARASFFGLNYKHDKKHMARAVLEGIVFNLYMLSDTIKEVSGKFTSIRATGGFTHSDLWLQILADIFEMPIRVQENQEAGCFAAMIMAQKALGLIENIEEVRQKTSTEKIYSPNPDNFQYYRALYPIFKNLTKEFEKSYSEISDYQERFSKS